MSLLLALSARRCKTILKNPMNFKGKVVLVTGGSAGIGADIAVHFAREGADVVIVGRNIENLNKTAAECAKVGKQAFAIQADLSKENELKSVLPKTIEKYGQLDVLINNAAVLKVSSLLDENLLEHFDDVYKLNLRAIIQLTQLAIPHLTKTKGNIINISSVFGTSTLSSPQFQSYSVMKAALDHFTRFSALELAQFGVRVNAVGPGPVMTEILEQASVDGGEMWAQRCPLKKLVTTGDVAEVVLFLAKAKSVTGSIYIIDNGLQLHN